MFGARVMRSGIVVLAVVDLNWMCIQNIIKSAKALSLINI